MASFYKQGDAWGARVRANGQERSRSAFKTKREAADWAHEVEGELRGAQGQKGLGPASTSLALALMGYAKDVVRLQKSCVQTVTRINKYLELAGLATLKASELQGPGHRGLDAEGIPVRTAQPVLFELTEVPPAKKTNLCRTFAAHRSARLAKRVHSMQVRARLARMPVSRIAAHDLHSLVVAMTADGYKGATIRLELALLSAFFEHARRIWAWKPLPNPALDVKWPKPGKGRSRVLSYQEEERLAAALCNRRNKAIAPVVWFAIETTMRKDELLVTSTWSDVNWDMSTITLYDAKSGGRDVPLTPAALAFLRALPQGGPAQRIFSVTKEALRAGWKRACKEADIVGLRIHDLRHTGATRHAKRLGGNIFLLQLVTGHKTLSQLARYVNVGTDDAVQALRQTEHAAPPPALAQMVPGATGAAASQPAPADPAPAAEAPASNVVVGPWGKKVA